MQLNSGGDQLARGLPKANFHGPNVTQEQWDAIWEPEVNSSDAGIEETGNGCVSITEYIADERV